jgi:thiamine-phosphate diphosphorylase
MKVEIPIGLYLVFDRALIQNEEPVAVLKELLSAGVRWIQYRDKHAGPAQMKRMLDKLVPVCSERGATLIVNDRPELAAGTGVHGVHLGRDDMPVPAARRMLGAGKIIGRTARTVHEAQRAERDGADYLGAGAMYPTATKTDTRIIGPDGLREVAGSVHLPVVAVGGVTPPRVADLVRNGAAGVAVASAILGAPDRSAAVRAFISEFEAYRRNETGI